MIDAGSIRRLYDRHERRPDVIDGMVREATALTLRFVNVAGGPGLVLHSTLDEHTADAAIEAEVERFRAAAQPFEWKLHDHDAPTDLAQRLAASGFTPEPEEVLVALDLAGTLPEVPPAVEIREVTSPADFDMVRRIRAAAFGRDRDWQDAALRAEHERTPDALRIYVAFLDGAPAAAGWSRLVPGTPFATLWGGGTVPALRRRGAYRALVARRLDEARARGYRHALVDAGPESLPILKRLGFVAIARMTPMVWRPDSSSWR